MENKIELYQQRDFGQVISATFDFIRQNFKPIFKSLLFICGPVLLLLLVFQHLYLSSIFTNYRPGSSNLLAIYTSPYYFASIFLGLLENGIVCCVIYGYISLYGKKGHGNVSFQDVLDLVKRKVGIIILATIVVGIMMVVGFVFLLIPGIFLGIATIAVPAIILNEELGIGEAISKSFKLTSGSWWETFGIVLVLYLITALLMGILSIPAYIIGLVNVFHSASSGESPAEALGTMVTILTIVVGVLKVFVYMIMYVGIAFQYYSLTEEKYHVGAQQKVNELGRN